MSQSSNKTIAKNTLFLFFRTLLIMGISLYTSRVVLTVLGVEDFGIYNVVGGIVSMLSFLNSAMVQASQRYLNFAQGTGDPENQRKVFSTSILIHATIAVVVVLLLETIGYWYVNNRVVLSPDRLQAANYVYQFSILIFLCRILVVPYNASVIAHEKMDVYAYISITDYVLQLFFVFLLKMVLYDKLITYGIMMLTVSCCHYLFYYLYTRRQFTECSFRWKQDWNLYREMFSFASWAFLGGAGYVSRNQGVNLVINVFCGPAVNASRGVAYQVSTAVQTLISSFQQSMNPQITKRYAAGEIDSMMALVRAGSKYSFLLLLVCFTPILIRPNYILGLWLVNVPEYADGFLIMAIVMALITSMGGPLNTAMQSTGNIKVFQIVVSIIMLLDIPLAYYLLTLKIEPYLVTSVSIFTSVLCLFAKLLILRRDITYNLLRFLISVVFRNLMVATIVIALFLQIEKLIPQTFLGLIILCFTSVFLNGIIIYVMGFEKFERVLLTSLVRQSINRLSK